MVDTVLNLNQLSIAVQFAVVLTIFSYFVLLGRSVRLREVRLWQFAWLAAITESLRHPEAEGPPISFAAGVAELFPAGDPTAALEEADRRMYAEKRGQ